MDPTVMAALIGGVCGILGGLIASVSANVRATRRDRQLDANATKDAVEAAGQAKREAEEHRFMEYLALLRDVDPTVRQVGAVLLRGMKDSPDLSPEMRTRIISFWSQTLIQKALTYDEGDEFRIRPPEVE